MENHKLILIYGAGSGFGKSTLAGRLTVAFEAKGLAVQFFEEHDITNIEAFRPYVDQVHAGHGDDADTLLACCEQYAADLLGNNPITTIHDSHLPGWDWLASAGCAQATISTFTQNLCDVLAPLNPMLVIVEGDLQIALERAVADRGETWGLSQAEARTGERSLDSFLNYFIRLRKCAAEALNHWRFPVIRVQTVTQPIDDSLQDLLDAI